MGYKLKLISYPNITLYVHAWSVESPGNNNNGSGLPLNVFFLQVYKHRHGMVPIAQSQVNHHIYEFHQLQVTHTYPGGYGFKIS